VENHFDVPHLLGVLCVMLGAAKLCGHLAQAIGQPSVLGELLAGVLVGKSALGLVDPSNEVLHVFGELGVVILLFSIGLETDLKELLRSGPSATAVAVVGVALPFALGYAVCLALGLTNLVAVVVGAALTATSVGITARVLADLGRLQDPEGQVILGAAILDDVIGLVILTVVAGLAKGRGLSALGVGRTALTAFGFLLVTILVGRLVVPRASRLVARMHLPGTPAILALMLAFGLAWLADRSGSAVIIGSFAAGLLLVGSPTIHDVEVGVTRLGHFFVPLFFVTVGAAVDVTVLNPLDPANHRTLLVAGLLTVAAVAGKFLAGYAPVWFKGRKSLIGAGMIPRGEVGLIFAQMGLNGGVLDRGMFAAVAVVMMVTTFIAPPLLKALAPGVKNHHPTHEPEGIEDLTTAG
jgi:Kef-type K+ transport system membrane component KefB